MSKSTCGSTANDLSHGGRLATGRVSPGSVTSSNMMLPSLNRSKTAPGNAVAVTRGDIGAAVVSPNNVEIPVRGSYTKKGEGEKRRQSMVGGTALAAMA